MPMKENLNDLRAFLVVAQTQSFTQAATLLGVSQSALSHSIRGIENRLKIKLLHRTTRSVSTTEAGEQLLQKLTPLFQEIDQEINNLSTFRNAVRGKLRINGTEHALYTTLWHKFAHFMQEFPEVELELVSENRFVDIVAEQFDAGIRLGDDLEKDMIAVRVSPDIRMCVVATPDYLALHGTPQTPHDLLAHECLCLRLTSGGVLSWEFYDYQQHKSLNLRVPHRFLTNQSRILIRATLAHQGLAWLPQDMVQMELERGQLISVLDDWAKTYTGYHLYYPTRRVDFPLFQSLVNILKMP